MEAKRIEVGVVFRGTAEPAEKDLFAVILPYARRGDSKDADDETIPFRAQRILI